MLAGTLDKGKAMAAPQRRRLGPAPAQTLEGPLNDQIYQRLKWALILGDYAPGEALSIRGITAETGTSMMPVREALKRLASERALSSAANRSFRVLSLEPKRIADLFFVRSCLEGIATELAAPILTSDQIDRLDELAGLMDRDIDARDVRNYLSRNYSFHFTIYTGAGNPELVSIIEGLWAQTGPFLASGVKDIGIEEDWRFLHGRIARAIRARDAVKARQLIETDINWGTRVYQALVEP